MKDIDWSKAPEGYPVWIEDLAPDTGFDGSGWHRDDGDRYTDEDGEYWTKPEEGIYRVHSQAPQWNSTGLPPVGAVCEVSLPYCNPEEWREITLRYVSTEYVVATIDGSEYAYSRAEFDNLYDTFRPIRTPEQITAEERDAGIEALFTAGNKRDVPAAYSDWAWMYDHGCRMTAEDEQ